ncbi:MAG TPA: rod-binding protein [Micropepsaceae bacterium]|nr:rod-binding protein [Micropepsaceae bacterium]
MSDFSSAASAQFSAAATLAKPALPPMSAKTVEQATKVAKDFEAVFINEIMGSMFAGISTDGPFGGGPGEGIFRSMMIENYSKSIAAQGGFGLADAVKHELLRAQEKAQ